MFCLRHSTVIDPIFDFHNDELFKIPGIEIDGRLLLNLLFSGWQPENKSYLHNKFILFA
jgi:hypothetical protein